MARKEEFVPDGHRVRTSPAEVVAAWLRYTQRIPAEFALGTAQHESNFTLNEVDTEESGFTSKGVFQLSEEEANDVDFPEADLLDLEDATKVFCLLCERRLQRIIQVANLHAENLPADVWAYLALAHNQGLDAALKSIERYGLNWTAYKQRNPQFKGMAAYGDDVISGGSNSVAALDGVSQRAPLLTALAS